MGEEKDDGLGLSLSLNSGCPPTPQNQPSLSLKLNLMHASHDHHQQQKNSWSEMLQSSDRTYLRGVDVNRAPPPTADCDQEVGVSSPNSTISSTICGKKGEREGNNGSCDDNYQAERASSSRGASNGEEYGGGDTGRKKLRLSKEQSVVLEETFKERNTLNLKQKSALAKQLKLRPRQVEVWFQNRRARTKLKQTEVDCEYLKRCCEKLTEENRGLQKEVQELRALKLSPQFYMNMAPPTTLLMCSSCERVSILSSSASAPVASRGGAALTHHHSAVNPPRRQYPLTPLPHKPLHH